MSMSQKENQLDMYLLVEVYNPTFVKKKKKIKPKSDRAPRSHYQFTRNTEDREHVKHHHKKAILKIQTVGNSIGETSQFPQE